MIRVLCLRCAEVYKATSRVTLYKLLTDRAKCETCGARDYCDEYEVIRKGDAGENVRPARTCVRRVCDGDCDNCPHPDCIDADGYWDYATPEERVLIRGPKCPERTKAMNALSGRRYYHTHPEQRQRMREYAKEQRAKARQDPEKLSRIRAAQRKHQQTQKYRNRKAELDRARYLRNREEILRRAKERYRQRKAAPGGDDSEGRQG